MKGPRERSLGPFLYSLTSLRAGTPDGTQGKIGLDFSKKFYLLRGPRCQSLVDDQIPRHQTNRHLGTLDLRNTLFTSILECDYVSNLQRK